MKRYSWFVAGFALVTAGIMSCDKINSPYSDKNGNNQNNDTAVRKVLLEDFTGHTCKSCPASHQEAQNLKGAYGNQLILVGIHCGDFADPFPGLYSYDFTTPEGTQLNTDYGLSAWPKGTINRKDYGTGIILDWAAWGTVIQGNNLTTTPPDANIKITNAYTSGTRALNVGVDCKFLTSFTGDYNLCVYLIEDSIIAAQLDGNINDTNYVHRHVFRHCLNGDAYGALLVSNPGANQTYSKAYNYNLPANFDENHCSIVAFITIANNKEVVQAEEEDIIP